MEAESCTIVKGVSFLSRWKILLDMKKSLGFICFKGLEGCGDESDFTKIWDNILLICCWKVSLVQRDYDTAKYCNFDLNN